MFRTRFAMPVRERKSSRMFLRKLKIESVTAAGDRRLCPVQWIDNFAMRNFTNDAIFDDTLPAGDGLLEAGSRVPLDWLRDAMEDWFRRKGYLKPGEALSVEELSRQIVGRTATSLRADRSCIGPVGISHVADIHFEKLNRVFTGENADADLMQHAVFDVGAV